MLKKNVSIHKTFEQEAANSPNNIAVRFLGEDTTYQALNRKANHLANHLRTIGVKPGDFVAVALSHSEKLVVSLLAILKCGAAYLPIDDANPTPRNKAYLSEVNAEVLIAANSKPKAYSVDLKIISAENNDLFSSFLDEFESYNASEDDAVYVMFTSGSTGKPKGVAVPHRAVIRLVKDTNYIEIKSSDRILQFAPPSFDASTFEFWGALLNGATLVPYSGDGLDPNLLKTDIEDNEITVLWLTAALFHIVAGKFIEILKPLRVLLAGGDVLNPKYINKLLDAIPGITVINGYGPTENTTFTCCHVMTTKNRPGGNVLIGKPITGTNAHILNNFLHPVERGEVGELFASGLGVALGYLNETNKNGSFFQDAGIASGLIYRTGDLVRENALGEFEFIGRKDNQVKIRGYRVSLEEIKTCIVELENVRDAIVITEKYESGDQLLVAYIQLKEGTKQDAKEIKAILASNVPAYMIPDKFIFNSKLPINENGKIDRKLILNIANEEHVEG